ncbi:MAG: hypothetical protein JXR78_09035 [Victivallales bacterium]|nr:hypothetical protein [Victivallales bacterium]
MKRISLFLSTMALTTMFMSVKAGEKQNIPKRTFRNFSGVCHGSINSEPLWKQALGWDRFDVAWASAESTRGKWNQKYIDKISQRILTAKSKGVTFLPIINYSVSWAAECPNQDFEIAGKRFTLKKQPDGRYELRGFNKSFINGKEQWEEVFNRKVSAHRMGTRWLSENHVSDWENYIRKIVSTYRQAPYELEYFQIWNEAWPTSSFWYGNMDSYMTDVHMPAAKIIHELGGKVVYGGWICGAPISELVKYMDKHSAWNSIDVFDLHYFPISSMEYLYRELSKRGLEHKGIWQTEIGFSSDPNYVGNVYPRVLHWALSRDWNWTDKFKFFYFAYSSPNDPKAYGFGRSLLLGKELSHSGRSLQAMAEIFSGGELKLYTSVHSKPCLKPELNEKLSSLESFKVGNKIICAIHMLPANNAKIFVDWNNNMDTIHLDYECPRIKLYFPEITLSEVNSVERISMYGSKIDISKYLRPESNGFSITVPVREPDVKEFQYTDMPESFLPEVFYTVINMKK